MAYLTPTDFRSASLNEVCKGLALEIASPDNVSDALLAAGIARVSQRIDDYTIDHFESQPAVAITLDVNYPTDKLYLPRRTTAVTLVETQDPLGTFTTQPAGSYRLRSSLDSTGGALRQPGSSVDHIDIIPLGGGLVSTYYGAWVWPYGPQAVRVTGTYGWTITPTDIKRALALMVFNHFKPIRQDLRMAETVSVADATIRFGQTFPSGIAEADDILYDYKRDQLMFVG